MSEGPQSPEEQKPDPKTPAGPSTEALGARTFGFDTRDKDRVTQTGKWRPKRSGKDGGFNGPFDSQGRTPSDPDFLTGEPEGELADTSSFDKAAASRMQAPDEVYKLPPDQRAGLQKVADSVGEDTERDDAASAAEPYDKPREEGH